MPDDGDEGGALKFCCTWGVAVNPPSVQRSKIESQNIRIANNGAESKVHCSGYLLLDPLLTDTPEAD